VNYQLNSWGYRSLQLQSSDTNCMVELSVPGQMTHKLA